MKQLIQKNYFFKYIHISYFKCSNTTPLLYPITNKNYASTGFISSQWNSLQYNIRSAFMITFFGYGAPKSYILGIKLMKFAWGNLEQRKMEQIKIIDVKSEEELDETWNPFKVGNSTFLSSL